MPAQENAAATSLHYRSISPQFEQNLPPAALVPHPEQKRGPAPAPELVPAPAVGAEEDDDDEEERAAAAVGSARGEGVAAPALVSERLPESVTDRSMVL